MDPKRRPTTPAEVVGVALVHARGAGPAAYTDQFHELARVVPYLVTPESKRIERYIYGLLKMGGEKRRYGGEPSKQAITRVDQKKAKWGKGFVATNPDSGADYSFVSTKFFPLLDVKSNTLNFSYVIEIENGRNEETNKIIYGCTLVLEDISFSVNLLPFDLWSFNVVVWMDWLSKHRAEIVFHEKIIHIILPNGETLEVREERSKEALKHHSNMNTEEKKLEDIPIVHDFPEVFPKDLSRLPLHVKLNST
ncbi:putative reverse transcriptase domain-containing protein [Tanacetum coccineum]